MKRPKRARLRSGATNQQRKGGVQSCDGWLQACDCCGSFRATHLRRRSCELGSSIERPKNFNLFGQTDQPGSSGSLENFGERGILIPLGVKVGNPHMIFFSLGLKTANGKPPKVIYTGLGVIAGAVEPLTMGLRAKEKVHGSSSDESLLRAGRFGETGEFHQATMPALGDTGREGRPVPEPDHA